VWDLAEDALRLVFVRRMVNLVVEQLNALDQVEVVGFVVVDQDDRARDHGAPSASGSETRKIVPFPGSDSQLISPPCSSTIFLHMNSPSPVPSPGGLVVKKGSNSRRWCSAAIPA